MANVSRPGLYYAQVKSYGFDPEKLKSKKYELRMKFVMGSKWTGKEWDGECAGLEIRGYFYPLTNKGTRNEGFRQMMMESFGWDGAKVSGLVALDKWCQIEVDEVEYEGKKSLKVQWIHHPEWVRPVDVPAVSGGPELDAIDAMYAGAAAETVAAPAVPGGVARPGGK